MEDILWEGEELQMEGAPIFYEEYYEDGFEDTRDCLTKLTILVSQVKDLNNRATLVIDNLLSIAKSLP